jgi:hypothetical protein
MSFIPWSIAPVDFTPPAVRPFTFAAKRAARERRRKLFRLVMFALGGGLLLCAFGLPAKAGARTLVIPLEDGYGFQDCLSKKRPCGFVVADAWCEAHGLAASKAFGRAEDMEGALADVRLADITPGSYLVTCGDAVN